jgi:hypothetical protein
VSVTIIIDSTTGPHKTGTTAIQQFLSNEKKKGEKSLLLTINGVFPGTS